MTDRNLATERLRIATSSCGQQRPRQTMTLFDGGRKDGKNNIRDDEPGENHGETGCYCKARTGPGYDTKYQKNNYNRGNSYFRSGGNNSSGGALTPHRFNRCIAQRVVQALPRVRFPGLKRSFVYSAVTLFDTTNTSIDTTPLGGAGSGVFGLISFARGGPRFESLGVSLLFSGPASSNNMFGLVPGSNPSVCPYYFRGGAPRRQITW
jgi:hypothetical protein